VEGHESEHFLLFFEKVVVQHGGIESGFKHVTPETYRPRLLHVKGTIKRTVVREVPLGTASLNSGDVFLLDHGLKLFQFQGKSSSGGEKAKGAQLARGIDDERGSKVVVVVLDESDEASASAKEAAEWKEFWGLLGGKAAIKADGGSDTAIKETHKQIYKVSDATGKLEFTEVPYKKTSLLEDDAFVVSTGSIVYTWIGSRATANEKKIRISICPTVP